MIDKVYEEVETDGVDGKGDRLMAQPLKGGGDDMESMSNGLITPMIKRCLKLRPTTKGIIRAIEGVSTMHEEGGGLIVLSFHLKSLQVPKKIALRVECRLGMLPATNEASKEEGGTTGQCPNREGTAVDSRGFTRSHRGPRKYRAWLQGSSRSHRGPPRNA